MYRTLEISMQVPRDALYPGCPAYEIRNQINLDVIGHDQEGAKDIIYYIAQNMYRKLEQEIRHANSGNY
jgi:signal recognition particle subunit SEC65